MSTGNTIRELRKQRHLSQTELAKDVHVSQATVTAWETGKAEPSSSALNTLASFFNVSADYLLGRKNSGTKSADFADEDTIFTYQGKEISAEDMDYIRGLLKRFDKANE